MVPLYMYVCFLFVFSVVAVNGQIQGLLYEHEISFRLDYPDNMEPIAWTAKTFLLDPSALGQADDIFRYTYFVFAYVPDVVNISLNLIEDDETPRQSCIFVLENGMTSETYSASALDQSALTIHCCNF